MQHVANIFASLERPLFLNVYYSCMTYLHCMIADVVKPFICSHCNSFQLFRGNFCLMDNLLLKRLKGIFSHPVSRYWYGVIKAALVMMMWNTCK